MPSVRDHHPRNHAQHSPNDPKSTTVSTIRLEPVHEYSVSNHICFLKYPESEIYSNNTRSRDKSAHASVPAHLDSSRHRTTMGVAASESMEFNSGISTLLSEAAPPRPATHKPAQHKTRHQRSKRLPMGRRKSTETKTQVSSWKTESSTPSSLPLAIPRVKVPPPAPEASQTHTTLSRPPQVNILPATPEVRQPLPLPGAVPTVTIVPPTPDKQLPCSPKGQHLEAPPFRLSRKSGEKSQHQASTTSRTQSSVRPQQDFHNYDSIIIRRSTDNLTGTYRGPPYQPFGRLNCPTGYKPRLQRHASFINLRDCWRCPEAELTARMVRRRRERSQPGEPARKSSPAAQETVLVQGETGDAVEADENTPLLAALQRALDGTREDDVNAAVTPAGLEPESMTKHLSSCMRALLSTVASPLTSMYAYIASAIGTYLHDREAHSGPLGSHDTETARWLQRVDTAFPEECSYRPFSSTVRPPTVSHHRTWRRRSTSFITASDSRKISRENIAPKDMRAVCRAMRWGHAIGEEYDPC
jgi:hypothetical protein